MAELFSLWEKGTNLLYLMTASHGPSSDSRDLGGRQQCLLDKVTFIWLKANLKQRGQLSVVICQYKCREWVHCLLKGGIKVERQQHQLEFTTSTTQMHLLFTLSSL